MMLDRRDLEVLVDPGAAVVDVARARERLWDALDASRARRFVLAPVRCICPRGFGAAPEPSCGAHEVHAAC